MKTCESITSAYRIFIFAFETKAGSFTMFHCVIVIVSLLQAPANTKKNCTHFFHSKYLYMAFLIKDVLILPILQKGNELGFRNQIIGHIKMLLKTSNS